MQPNVQITATGLQRQIRGKSREEQIAYLMNLPAPYTFTLEEAEDFVNDYERNRHVYQKAVESTEPFSQSEKFKQMVERFQEKVYDKRT